MYTGIVVTHRGPCKVTHELLEKILARKSAESKFGAQILFSIEFVDDENDIQVVDGTVENISTMVEFDHKFIVNGQAALRVISL